MQERIEVSELTQVAEVESKSYYHNLLEMASSYGIDVYPDYEASVNDVLNQLDEINKKKGLPISIRQSDDKLTRLSGLFFHTNIKPLIARGSDSYRLTQEDIEDFCLGLARHEPTTLLLYYALTKTRSPNRTGSPDTKIDLAEIEMLKLYGSVTGTAERLGLSLKILILDETSEMPNDPYLGFTDEDRQTNSAVFREYLTSIGADDKVTIRTLSESVRVPLEDRFQKLYEGRKEIMLEQINEQVQENQSTALTARMKVFLDCMPDSGLLNIGLHINEIRRIRSEGKNVDLKKLSPELYNYIANITAHFGAVMQLRDEASKAALEFGTPTQYPEYYNNGTVYGGVTRSKRRWSFLPHPIRWKGITLNPMHGLSIYNKNRKFAGCAPYIELAQLESKGEMEIVRINTKPIAAISLF